MVLCSGSACAARALGVQDLSQNGYLFTGRWPEPVSAAQAAEKIRAVLEDVSLCVLEDVSVINGSTRLRGCRQTFEFDNRGRHVKAYGSDLQACGDAEHCPQAWFLACALEKVRKILVPLGVPRKCFRL